MFFRAIHEDNLPTVRIAEVHLENFKSVKNGTIVFNCGRKFVEYGTRPDILGLYGQNGSGKTSLIEAISILRYALSGESIPEVYVDCIDVSSDYALLSFVFDFQYPIGNEYESNNDKRKIYYSFKIARAEAEEHKGVQIFFDKELEEFLVPSFKKRIKLYDEILQVSGTINGKRKIKQPFCDTSVKGSLIEPASKAKMLVGDMEEEISHKIYANREIAEMNSQSFVFHSKMMQVYKASGNYSPYYQMLLELQYFARYYLYVIDTKSIQFGQNFVLPILARKKAYNMRVIPYPIQKPIPLSDEMYIDLCKRFESMSIVLEEVVPGLQIKVREINVTKDTDGDDVHTVELLAVRNGREIPLRCESDGVRKLISTLSLLIAVYNHRSVTVAYDEFDSGIFEYLLGEILQVLQSSGKGQFIFTSHNMRPLEVLDRNYVWFTSTDPDNRYVRINGLSETNNLRKVYYREITLQEHYDNLYSETKRNKIVSAMRKAGGEN